MTLVNRSRLTRWTIRGANGVTFDLTSGTDVQLSGEGVQGIGEYAPAEIRRSRGATNYGASRSSSRYEPSTGTITVTLNPDDLDVDLSLISRRWWSIWSYDQPARLTAFTPGGWEPVSLDVYLAGENLVEGELPDPHIVGSFETQVRVEADEPLWRGPERELIRIHKSGSRSFFPGLPFRLTSAYARGRRTVNNVGPLPMFPVWTIVGPVSDWKLTAGTAVLAGSVPVSEGEVLTVDTRPGRKSAKLTSAEGAVTNVTDTLLEWGFGSIPSGRSEIGVEFTGDGVVTAVGETLYPRRW